MIVLCAWKRLVQALALAALFSAAPTMASATPILYGVTIDGNQLIRINPTTGAGTLVGALDSTMGAFGLGGFGGRLYTYDQNADVLREINPLTAATVNTIDLGLGDLVGEGGLDFRSDGVGFLGVGSADRSLYRFTLTPGSGTLVGSVVSAGIDGLAFNSSDVLYMLGQSTRNLYTVNQTTAALTLIGNTGLPVLFGGSVGGLEFIGATLYASIDDGNLYSVNTLTGAATLIGPTGFARISGLAVVDDVPEPSSALLLLTGVLGLYAGVRRRKQRHT